MSPDTHPSAPPACEAKIEGAWLPIDLFEAAGTLRLAMKRCPACHGSLALHGTYDHRGFNRFLKHRKAHDGCPLMPKTYSGTPSPHPQALA